jgi:hypothetical protein
MGLGYVAAQSLHGGLRDRIPAARPKQTNAQTGQKQTLAFCHSRNLRVREGALE